MLTKKRLIEKLKEHQDRYGIPSCCISVAQDRYFLNGKVKYDLFMFTCDKKELYLDATLKNSLRWWQEGKTSLDHDSVLIGAFPFIDKEYEHGFENCRFNLSELLGE